MANAHKVPFLVVSSNQYLRGIIKFVLETLLHADVTELESEEKALLYLKGLTNFPGMIIYDYEPNAYLLEDFVMHLKKSAKDVRIVILIDKIREEGKELLKDISQITLMDETLLPMVLVDEAKKVFTDHEAENKDEYCQVELRFLNILDGVNKNLFIKLGSSKFVRIFNEDDNTGADDIQKYMSKGVQQFYVTRATALWVIEQVQKQINLFLRSSNFRFILRGANDSPEKRFEQKILRINDEVHIDNEFKEVIDQAIGKVKKIVETQKNVEALLSNLKDHTDISNYYNAKVRGTASLACLLAKQLDWSSRMTIDKLIFASTLCDITLCIRPHLLKIPSLEEFEKVKGMLKSDEQKMFLQHPKEGAELIKNYFTSAPPETDILALQHHEMPSGDGFPGKIKAERIAPLSALFIIANHCAVYFLEDEAPSMQDYLLKAESKFDSANFRKVLKALEKLKKN